MTTQAQIEEGSQVSETAQVWHHSIIRRNSKIGAGCIIGSFVYIDEGVEIGDNCKIQNYSCIYSGVTIEAGVFIGPRVTFTNVINPRSFISRKNEFRSTRIHMGASIGASATIICGTTVGSYAFIGASSLVNRDIGQHELWLGVPAKKRGYFTRWGERLELPSNVEREIYTCPRTGDNYEYDRNSMLSTTYSTSIVK